MGEHAAIFLPRHASSCITPWGAESIESVEGNYSRDIENTRISTLTSAVLKGDRTAGGQRKEEKEMCNELSKLLRSERCGITIECVAPWPTRLHCEQATVLLVSDRPCQGRLRRRKLRARSALSQGWRRSRHREREGSITPSGENQRDPS